jgi:hypothetical protein
MAAYYRSVLVWAERADVGVSCPLSCGFLRETRNRPFWRGFCARMPAQLFGVGMKSQHGELYLIIIILNKMNIVLVIRC